MTRVLLITAGETPQIVTETIWALARRSPPWRPDRICLATTLSGARLYEGGNPARAIPALLGTDGRLAALWKAVWPDAPLPCVHLLVASRDGQPLPDLRAGDEVERFAETLLKEVAAITADPHSTLHLSLAGGRKTMSFIAGQVMSLLGRPQDVLSHVLVEPAELERRPDFWWPGDGSPGSETAQVLLHEVPYLRARAWLDPDQGLDIGSGYAAVVDRANRELSADRLLVDLNSKELQVAGRRIRLNTREIALVALVAIARRRGVQLERVELGRDAERRPINGITLARSHEDARRIWGWLFDAANGPGKPARRPQLETAREEAEKFFSYDTDIGQPASRLRRKLRKQLTERTAERVLASEGLQTRFSPEGIRIIGPAALANDPDCPPEVDCAP